MRELPDPDQVSGGADPVAERRPNAKAMVVIRRPHDGALLVSRDTDITGNDYERPLGGHIEFGEHAADTVRREIREELGQELADVRLLGVRENIFQLNGVPGHEIVFIFTAQFHDEHAYEIQEQAIMDDPSRRIRVRWRHPQSTAPPLVPEGILREIATVDSTE